MNNDLPRRRILTAAPAVGLSALMTAFSLRAEGVAALSDIYRIDDQAKILAAAKMIIEQDFIGTLITLDVSGVPRARSIGVWAPDNDFVLWMGTRRTSRKVDQIRNNPNATLHFAQDDTAGNFANAYYASFMGTASVHVDDETVNRQSPEEKYRRAQWPNFPHDYAAIRFETKWIEVAGQGISGDKANWQPQAVVLS